MGAPGFESAKDSANAALWEHARPTVWEDQGHATEALVEQATPMLHEAENTAVQNGRRGCRCKKGRAGPRNRKCTLNR